MLTNEKMNLPQLKGTEKQIKWAISIRDRAIAEADSYIATFESMAAKESDNPTVAGDRALILSCRAALVTHDEAKWWIEKAQSFSMRSFVKKSEAGIKRLEEVGQKR